MSVRPHASSPHHVGIEPVGAYVAAQVVVRGEADQLTARIDDAAAEPVRGHFADGVQHRRAELAAGFSTPK